jgi:hypothetical protein
MQTYRYIEIYAYPPMIKMTFGGRLAVKKVYVRRPSPSSQRQLSAIAVSGAVPWDYQKQ